MKKFFWLAVLCLWVLGTIGGIGFALYGGAKLIAIAVAVLGVLSFPTAEKAFKELTA